MPDEDNNSNENQSIEIKEKQSVTKSDIANAKNKEQIRAIERKGNIKAANDWIGFGVSKATGLGSVVVGGLEWVDPNILPIALERPEIVVGVGLALLAGKGIIDLIAKVSKYGDE